MLQREMRIDIDRHDRPISCHRDDITSADFSDLTESAREEGRPAKTDNSGSLIDLLPRAGQNLFRPYLKLYRLWVRTGST